jgi:hypothetical protein
MFLTIPKNMSLCPSDRKWARTACLESGGDLRTADMPLRNAECVRLDAHLKPQFGASTVSFEWVPYGPPWLRLQPDSASKSSKILYIVFSGKTDQPGAVR